MLLLLGSGWTTEGEHAELQLFTSKPIHTMFDVWKWSKHEMRDCACIPVHVYPWLQLSRNFGLF
jgi:hypothetical protein